MITWFTKAFSSVKKPKHPEKQMVINLHEHFGIQWV